LEWAGHVWIKKFTESNITGKIPRGRPRQIWNRKRPKRSQSIARYGSGIR